MRRLIVLVVLVALVVLAFRVLSPTQITGRTDAGRYVSTVSNPISDLATWAQDVLTFYGDVLQLRQVDAACSTDRLSELIARGERIIGQLRDAAPPRAIASLHHAVANGGDKVLDNLRQVQELLCQQRDLARAKELVEQAQSSLRDLPPLLESLRERLGEL